MAIHFFGTSGAVTSVGPTAAQLDTTTTVTGTGATNVFGTTYKAFSLVSLVVRKLPTVAAIVTIKSGSTTIITLTVPTANVPPYLFQGIPLPSTAELNVTTTQDADLLFVVDAQASIV